MSGEINIALATDIGYLKQTMVVVESVMINGTLSNTYHFHILTDAEAESAFLPYKEKICKKYNNCVIDCIVMADVFENVDIHIEHITKPTYYRLLLPELVPCDRCIYLDCDVIVCEDLADMYHMEMDDCEIAGVVAPVVFTFSKNGKEYMQKIGLPSLNQYVNAGVLLMHLANMRTYGFCEKIDLLLNKQFPTQDQDIINIASYGFIKLLPYRYNVQIKRLSMVKEYSEIGISDEELQEAKVHPYIIHYSTAEKPWEFFDIPYADKWWETCRKTIVCDEFFDLYRSSFYYYGVIKNKSLWRLEKFSEPWLEEIRNYDDLYVYGAGVKGKRAVEYLVSNNITIKAVLVSTMDNNAEYVQGVKVECLASQVTDRDLVILALKDAYLAQVRRMLFKKNIFNVIGVEEI